MVRHVFFFREGDTYTGYYSNWYLSNFTAPVPAACIADHVASSKKASEPAPAASESTRPEPTSSEAASVEPRSMTFNCMEQYMMYHKAILCGDADTAGEIMKVSKQRTQKQLGRVVEPFDEELWDANKFAIVCEGCYWKFMKEDDDGEELRAALLGTEEKNLVEASPFDKIWGIGLKAEDAKHIPEEKWKGQNLLGKALMRARERIRKEKAGQDVPADWNKL